MTLEEQLKQVNESIELSIKYCNGTVSMDTMGRKELLEQVISLRNRLDVFEAMFSGKSALKPNPFYVPISADGEPV